MHGASTRISRTHRLRIHTASAKSGFTPPRPPPCNRSVSSIRLTSSPPGVQYLPVHLGGADAGMRARKHSTNIKQGHYGFEHTVDRRRPLVAVRWSGACADGDFTLRYKRAPE